MGQQDLLSLAEIARELGVNRQAAAKWHKAPTQKAASGPPRTPSALRAVAKAMEIEVPEADERAPRYPRSVVDAFAKAVGYKDAEGRLVPEIQAKPAGRWSPVEPTIEPGPLHRRRYYLTHAAAELGYRDSYLDPLRSRGKFVAEDGYDELNRPYWFLETLQAYRSKQEDDRERRKAGPEPDGYLDNGQPYWNAGPDNYWTRKWRQNQDQQSD